MLQLEYYVLCTREKDREQKKKEELHVHGEVKLGDSELVKSFRLAAATHT